MAITNFEELFNAVKKQPVKRVVAVNGVDINSLEALNEAVEKGIVSALLTGKRAEIEKTCKKMKCGGRNFEIHHAGNESEAAEKAVALILEGKADMIMKGLIPTDKFIRALLRKEYGLIPQGSMLSHVSVMENAGYHKLLFFADAGIVPYPDLKKKIIMLGYLIKTANSFGVEKPKVAVIAPTEQILISLQSCTDAAVITKMAESGQIEGAFVDGPLALDVAVNSESALIKGLKSQVAGDADALLFQNIDAANVFYKTNSKLSSAKMAGFITGAKIPVIVSSRGDSVENKLNSIALASFLSEVNPTIH